MERQSLVAAACCAAPRLSVEWCSTTASEQTGFVKWLFDEVECAVFDGTHPCCG